MRPYALALAIAVADGLVVGVPSAARQCRSRRAALPSVQMRVVPGTLQFSAFKGYFVSTDDGKDYPVSRERIGKGLDMGDRVDFDADADATRPLVTPMRRLQKNGASAPEPTTTGAAATQEPTGRDTHPDH